MIRHQEKKTLLETAATGSIVYENRDKKL